MERGDAARSWLIPILLVLYGGSLGLLVAGRTNWESLQRFGWEWTVVFWGPMTEEGVKGLGVVLATLLVRGPGDGARFGLASGLGFGIGEAFQNAGDAGEFVVRILLLTLMHAGAGALTGIGHGWTVQTRRPWGVMAGFALAVLLHGSYNLLVVQGGSFWGPLAMVFLAATVIGTAISLDDDGPEAPRHRTKRPRWR